MFFVLLVMPFAFLGLWKLFREVGMYSDPYGDLPHMKVDASTMELDPILCAGIVKVLQLKERLKRCPEVHFVLPGLVLITEPLPDNFFGVGFNMGKRHTAAKWAEHLRKLKRWAVLIDVKYDKLLHVAYYFAVPKKGRRRPRDLERKVPQLFLASFSASQSPILARSHSTSDRHVAEAWYFLFAPGGFPPFLSHDTSIRSTVFVLRCGMRHG